MQPIAVGLSFDDRRLQRTEEDAGGIGGVNEQLTTGVLIVIGTMLEDLFNSTYGPRLFSELVPDIEYLGDFYFQISGQVFFYNGQGTIPTESDLASTQSAYLTEENLLLGFANSDLTQLRTVTGTSVVNLDPGEVYVITRTETPSASPSEDPSSPPSSLPSREPSSTPSTSPSDLPSSIPSSMPSDGPSSAPSAGPSVSHAPTISHSPTTSPTISPKPSVSAEPSSIPSALPSSLPSLEPSGSPSLSPSAIPSTSVSFECFGRGDFSDFYIALQTLWLTLYLPATLSLLRLLSTAANKQPFGIAKCCSIAVALDSSPDVEALANANSPIWKSDEASRDAGSVAVTKC